MSDTMKEGDIYFWRWKDGVAWSYHCRSQKAVVIRGKLRDTFWNDYASNGERTLEIDKVDLTYMGNRDEMATISPHETSYYRPEDVVDMRHANSSGALIYVKAGARRDPATMTAHLEYRIEREESNIRFATNEIERLRAAIKAVQEGRLAEVYL